MLETTRLTVLVNNNVYEAGLQGEHGWSVLLETSQDSLIFDLGQSNLYQKNAAVLGYTLKGISRVILSHGHDDHTGGLPRFLKMNPEAIIYAHPDVFKKRYSLKAGRKPMEIGMPKIAPEFMDNFSLSRKPREIMPDVWLTGEIKRIHASQEINQGLCDDSLGKTMDSLLDDQSMILNTCQGLVVVLGCCHAGLANTLEAVAEITGEREFYMILGGMHLSQASTGVLKGAIIALEKYRVKKVGHAHCSGWLGMAALRDYFKGEIFSCDVGQVIEIK